jgi:hypothetical protein
MAIRAVLFDLGDTVTASMEGRIAERTGHPRRAPRRSGSGTRRAWRRKIDTALARFRGWAPAGADLELAQQGWTPRSQALAGLTGENIALRLSQQRRALKRLHTMELRLVIVSNT